MKRLFCAFVLFLAAVSAFPQAVPNPPRIVMTVPGAEEGSVRLTDLNVNVQVTGNIAITTCDMTFTNSSARTLEGEFEFPLGQAQTVVGYALDINGRMRQGVAVEKEKARTVFEDVARRNVDPGLVEQTSGSNFRTRVYPLPAKGSRRIQISYQEELPVSGTQRSYVLQPLCTETLSSFKFDISVYSIKSAPSMQASPGFSSFDFDSQNTACHASFERSDYRFERPVSIILPQDDGANSVFMQEIGKDTYFYFYTPVKSAPRTRTLPQKLTVYWDVSASMKNRDFKSETALLHSYLNMLDSPSVTVIPFSNTVHGAKTFRFTHGIQADEIDAFLKDLTYDGATCLDFLHDLDGTEGEVLLFTDGLENWNGNADAVPALKNTVYTVNSSPSADHSRLKALAQKNGGMYADLSSVSVDQALELFTKEYMHLIRADYDSDAVSDFVPGAGAIADGDFSAAGILRKKSAQIALSFGYGNTVTEVKKFSLSALEGERSGGPKNIARLWAQKKIQDLSADYGANRDAIIALAKKFTVVTKDTSLIVLDSASDYARYGIEPPDELRAEYSRIVQSGSAKNAESQGIPDAVFRKFQEFREWWNKKPQEFRTKKKNSPVSAPSGDAVYMMETSSGVSVQDSAVSLSRSAGTSTALSVNEASAAKEKSQSGGPSISIQAWNPDAQYLAVLKRTPADKMYEKYLELRESYASSPSFYMDAADYFREEGMDEVSVRILSNLAELNLENSDVLRALGNKLVEWGCHAQAVSVFRKLTVLRPEIPQFYRDLGLSCYSAGYVQEAVDALYFAASHKWDSRFDEIQQAALNDMNAIIAREKGIDTSAIDSRLIQNFPVDIRVVLTWNTDDCDIDLWVTDPDGEKCFYGNRLTQNGGRISRDFTQGYGPEEFCIREAVKGKYRIEANYYGTRSQKILQPVVVQAEVYTRFGTPEQEKQVLTLRLENVKGSYTVGEIVWK